MYAYKHECPGSNGKKVYYTDLMYNRKNWRDLNKDKSISRQEAQEELQQVETEAAQYPSNYEVNKAIARIRRIHSESEVRDQYSKGAATQVHHIFPRSEYPEIADRLENLILLTGTQHSTLAHPKNHTQIVDREYQLTCLLAKCDTIEASLRKFGEKDYYKEKFIHVINTGLAKALEAQGEAPFATTATFAEIKEKLRHLYLATA